MTADADENFRCAPADVKLTKDRRFVESMVPARYRSEFIMTEASKVDYVGVCPIQIISVATSMIPFIEHDDANRALMGSMNGINDVATEMIWIGDTPTKSTLLD